MTEQAISPLRRRMIEDTAIRKFAQKTQRSIEMRESRCHRRIKNPVDLRDFSDGRVPFEDEIVFRADGLLPNRFGASGI